MRRWTWIAEDKARIIAESVSSGVSVGWAVASEVIRLATTNAPACIGGALSEKHRFVRRWWERHCRSAQFVVGAAIGRIKRNALPLSK
jgi:hypothetical protein